MITVASLREILDSIEQSTNNPNLKIQFNIDHGEQMSHDPDPPCKDSVNVIQSIKIDSSINIDPESPEPQKAPDTACIITLE